MAKTSKATGTDKEKKKKNKKSGPSAKAMKQQAPKPNPFESIWSRRKFDILGKKRKGEERRIGLARSRAIDKVLEKTSVAVLSFPFVLVDFNLPPKKKKRKTLKFWFLSW